MKEAIIVFILGVAFVGCQSGTGSETENKEDTVVKVEENTKKPEPLANVEECYRFIAQRDTYDIKITRNGELSHGFMHFNNYEKDDAKGSFTGTIVKDNIIKAIYKFESEGMKSTREIFLKDEGNQLVTGIGEEDVKGDSAFVKDPNNISFTGEVYKKVNCSEIR